MKSEFTTVEGYMASLADDRKEAITKLREIIKNNLPIGFQECFSYGMIAYVVPHSIYPKGYNCDPKQPLPFISLASQKSHIAIYHMGLYADNDLLNWFTAEYAKLSKTKLDMGKSCIRFKKAENIPYQLIAELCSKVTPAEWIDRFETAFVKK